MFKKNNNNIFTNPDPRNLFCTRLANSNTVMCINDAVSCPLFKRKLKGREKFIFALCTLVGHLTGSNPAVLKAFSSSKWFANISSVTHRASSWDGLIIRCRWVTRKCRAVGALCQPVITPLTRVYSFIVFKRLSPALSCMTLLWPLGGQVSPAIPVL